jgi:hypothetical protein
MSGRGREKREREVFKTKLMAFLKKHEIDFWMPQKQERKRNERKRTKFSQLNLFREDYFLRSERIPTLLAVRWRGRGGFWNSNRSFHSSVADLYALTGSTIL